MREETTTKFGIRTIFRHFGLHSANIVDRPRPAIIESRTSEGLIKSIYQSLIDIEIGTYS
jgi:hypothetical protein